jgi:CheY-like chemotaxis protein
VALTASVLSDVLDNLVHQGFDDYATKPFVPNELFFKIGTQLIKK